MSETVGQPKMSRKARWRAAVALAGITAKDWCAGQNISEAHFYLVLRGKRESPPLLAKIDAFIAKQLDEPTPAPQPASTVAA